MIESGEFQVIVTTVPALPVRATIPSLTATQPPGIGSSASVTRSSLSRTRRSNGGKGLTSTFNCGPSQRPSDPEDRNL